MIVLQKIAFNLADISFQAVAVNKGRDNALAGDAESCGINSDAHSLFQRISVEQVGSQGADKSVAGTGSVYGSK